MGALYASVLVAECTEGVSALHHAVSGNGRVSERGLRAVVGA
jgi:hypothetical protein